MATEPSVKIRLADLELESDADMVLFLLNEYAKHAMGQGSDLAPEIQARLIPGLKNHPTTIVFVAEQEREGTLQPAGIASCFFGYSTFKAGTLINVHDLFVVDEVRGSGVGGALLDAVIAHAKSLDCVAVSLEVRSDNPARFLYEKKGFEGIKPKIENGTEYQTLFGKHSLV